MYIQVRTTSKETKMVCKKLRAITHVRRTQLTFMIYTRKSDYTTKFEHKVFAKYHKISMYVQVRTKRVCEKVHTSTYVCKENTTNCVDTYWQYVLGCDALQKMPSHYPNSFCFWIIRQQSIAFYYKYLQLQCNRI